jgi:stage V sporulation protein S
MGKEIIFLFFFHIFKYGRRIIMEILKVSSKSNPSKVAGAIANIFREKKNLEIQTIGAGSLNQAVKAIAIARGFVTPSGEDIVVTPAFSDVIINNEQKTAMKLILEAK